MDGRVKKKIQRRNAMGWEEAGLPSLIFDSHHERFVKTLNRVREYFKGQPSSGLFVKSQDPDVEMKEADDVFCNEF